MAKVYLTSDTHWDHANIIRYSDRPFLHNHSLDEEGNWVSNEEKFKCCSWMNEMLIEKWNNKVNPDDVVYHLGDFGFGSGCYEKFAYRLNGRIDIIQGNHDSNNGVKTYLHSGIMLFGGMEVYVRHIPPKNRGEVPSRCSLVCTGHIHNNWKTKWLDDVPMINVGVDVWDYEPVGVESILKCHDKMIKFNDKEV